MLGSAPWTIFVDSRVFGSSASSAAAVVSTFVVDAGVTGVVALWSHSSCR